MNPKRLILAMVVVFVATFATDFLIHAVWLANDYGASKNLWRPEAEMGNYFCWLLSGQLLAAVTFTVVYAKGFAANASMRCGVLYGLFMGLFSQATTLITYAVQPFPGSIAAKWMIAGIGQGILLGLLLFFVYKPKPPSPLEVKIQSTQFLITDGQR